MPKTQFKVCTAIKTTFYPTRKSQDNLCDVSKNMERLSSQHELIMNERQIKNINAELIFM